MIKAFKKGVYKTVENFGLRAPYIILLFKVRSLLKLKSKEEKRLKEFYFRILKTRSRLIFDIGANVGIRTSVFAEISDKVIALEPNKELVGILESRFSPNRVVVLDKACAADSSSKEIYIGDNHLISSLSEDFIHHKTEYGLGNSWKRKEIVKTCSLDELISDYGIPDFCKIDVEGFEKEVLKGLSKKIGMISFEFNYPSFEQETLWCLSKLKDLGYTSFNFSMAETLEFYYENWVSFEEISFLFRLNNTPFQNGYGDIYAS